MTGGVRTLTREHLFRARIHSIEIEVPGFAPGSTERVRAYVRELTAGGMAEVLPLAEAEEAGTGNSVELMMAVLARCLCDEDGGRLFADDAVSVREVREAVGVSFRTLADFALAHCGMVPAGDDAEDLDLLDELDQIEGAAGGN